MKFIIFGIISVAVLFVADSAPKNDKKPKKEKKVKQKKGCNECRLESEDLISPICGVLNGIEDSFRSTAEFSCVEICRNAKGTITDDKRPCEKDKNDPLYKSYWKEDEEKPADSEFPDPCDCKRPEFKQGPLYPVCSAVIGVMTTIDRKLEADCLEECSNGAVVFNHTGPCFGDRAKYRDFLFLAPYSPRYNQTNIYLI